MAFNVKIINVTSTYISWFTFVILPGNLDLMNTLGSYSNNNNLKQSSCNETAAALQIHMY